MTAADPASGGGSAAAAAWFAALTLLAALLVACCYKRKRVRAALQAGGMAPKRAKIDPNPFGDGGGAAASSAAGDSIPGEETVAEAQAAVCARSPTYHHGRKRLASVVPEGIGAAGAAGAVGPSDDAEATPEVVSAEVASSEAVASLMALATKSFKGVRDAVIRRSGALLSDSGPRSDAGGSAAADRSGSTALKRAQTARRDWFKRLFPNSHARLMEQKAVGEEAEASSARGAPSPELRVAEGPPGSGKGGIGGGLLATRL